MKKQLLITGLLIGSIFSTKAQTVLFSQDFSSITPPALTDWSLVDLDGDGNNWGVSVTENTLSTAQGFVGGFASSASYINSVGALTPDNLFVTEIAAIPAGNGGSLSFKIGALDPAFPGEHYAVYAVDADEFDLAASNAEIIALLTTPLIEQTLTTAIGTVKTLSLDAYTGQNIRIVFRHYQSTDVYRLLLDDVKVTTQVLAVNNFDVNQFSVYPNPVKDIVSVKNSQNIAVNGIIITDLNGRTVKTVNYSTVSDNIQVNVSDLSSGVYMMNIKSDKGSVTKKIVKS